MELNKEDIFARVAKWNKDRDNTSFSHFNETKMLAEELFEFCGYTRSDAKEFGEGFAIAESSKEYRFNHDMLVDAEVGFIAESTELVDAAGDLIFIAIGTIMKLGHDPYTVLKTICDANDAKGNKKDADGKILKDDTFIEPIH